jgi:hypothetical protein
MLRGWIWSIAVYNAVGGTIGYVLAPLALSGFLVVPVWLIFFEEGRNWAGLLFVLVAIGAFLCNVYLAARNTRLESGSSHFPALVLIAGTSALLLLGYKLLPAWQLYAGCALLAALDLLGQSFIGVMLGKRIDDGA